MFIKPIDIMQWYAISGLYYSISLNLICKETHNFYVFLYDKYAAASSAFFGDFLI